jgi:DNA-3-methyladenine glycosylase II
MNAREYASQLAIAERSLSRSGPLMRGLIRRHGPCGLSPRWRQTPYESLITAVIHQQISGRVAGTILERLTAALGTAGRMPGHHDLLQASEEQLRAVGLSRQKAAYLHAIARETAAGVVPTKRGVLGKVRDEAIIARMIQVKGVGRWTAEMMLIFTLGRLDVWPVDDFGVRKGYTVASKSEEMVAPGTLKAIGTAWAPYRSVAAWYFWQEANAA